MPGRKRLGKACWVAAAVALVLGAAGCGSTDVGTVGAEAPAQVDAAARVDDPAGPWPQMTDRGVLAAAPADVRACVERNDHVVPWRTTDVMETTRWAQEGRQSAFQKVIGGVHRYLRETRVQTGTRVSSGFLGYALDPANSRLVMQIDPTVLDMADFRRMTRTVARKANRDAHVQGDPLTVTVQRGCFSAAEVSRLNKLLRGRASLYIGSVQLDGRIHGFFCGKQAVAEARDLQKHVGPILAVEEDCADPLSGAAMAS